MRTLPLYFRYSSFPPGFSGAIFASVYRRTVAVSVSFPVCANPGPAQTPLKSGLPSAARGMPGVPGALGAVAVQADRVTVAASSTRLPADDRTLTELMIWPL